MAAINSFLLLLTTIAPPDPSRFNEDLPACAPFLKLEGGENWGCPVNEHYEECGGVCPKSCIQYECPLRCCVEGCFCDEGYVRGPDGTCIPERECPHANRIETFDSPKACGPDEYIGCDSHCQRNCSNYHDVIMCDKTCVLDCICILPKIRGPEGTCILPQQCPTSPALPCNNPLGCSDEDSEDFPQDDTVDRNKLKNDRCRPGQFYSCGCKRTCDNYQQEEEIECQHECGCACLPPRVRARNGACVLPEECPTIRETQIEEHMKMAAMICNFVRIMGNPPAWSESCPMIVHECTDPSECSKENSSPPLLGQFSVCRKNEYLNFMPSCPVTCDNYQSETKECKITDKVVPRCDCKEGLVRDSYSSCIPPEACPVEKLYECSDSLECYEENASPPDLGEFSICRKNEYLTIVPFCPVTCDNYQNVTKECKITDRVVPRCDCKEGLVRDSYGGCIPPEDCSDEEVPECTDPTECTQENSSPQLLEQFLICRKNEYLNILPSCPVTCDNYQNKNKECRIADLVVPRCDCKEGFVRDSYGRCIPPANCPVDDDSKKCPKHEKWTSCGTACPKTCENFDDSNSPCIQICRVGCFCVEPRVRGPDGRCILTEECPPKSNAPQVCPENEYYDPCEGHCQKDCDNYDKGLVCPKCVPGCVCVPPMVRGPDCQCIGIEECPAERQSSTPCPQILCRKGYFLDAKAKPCPRCVECPLLNCLRGCRLDTTQEPCPKCVCDQQLEGRPCPQILCRKGYFLDAKAKPCPRCVACPIVECLPGCRLDTTQEQCPKCVCDQELEVFEPPCPRIRCDEDCYYDTNITRCPVCVCHRGPPCPQIRCRKGYFLDARAKPCPRCVACPIVDCLPGCRLDTTQEPCPTCVCDQNLEAPVCPKLEYWNECGSACPKTCSNRGQGRFCPAVCVRGCFCKSPLIRGPRGDCIEPENCP